MNCPLKLTKPDCSVCPFSKDSLCDYPWIGTTKVEVHGNDKPTSAD